MPRDALDSGVRDLHTRVGGGLRRLPASRELTPLEYDGVAHEIREIAEQLQQERG